MMMSRVVAPLLGGLALLAAAPTTTPAHARDPIDIPIVYLERMVDAPPTLSNLNPPPDDLGLAGARLGLRDNQTTGRFLGQNYTLEEIIVAPDGDFAAAAADALTRSSLLVVNAPAADLLAVADSDAARAAAALILNAGAADVALRREDCRANVLHAIPSRAMQADALAQFLMRRQWSRWLLIRGPYPGDRAYAAAIEAAAAKFGARIVAVKDWTFDADMRRNAAQEVPLFTQTRREYDVVIVADETDDFGRYIPHNTWLPRPVVGTEGLSPVAWAPVVEQWGAAQLNNRFERRADREMLAADYAAWAAVRIIGEAVTRTGGADPATLRGYILSDRFELAGFKGRKMTVRTWNGQLRQPIPLVHPRALAALAPLEGYTHRVTALDTLGYDAPESGCAAFAD